MRPNFDEIGHLLRTGHGVIRRCDHPHLATSLTYLVTIGRLAAVLPGIYAESSTAGLAGTRMRAAAAREPNGVLTGAAAARLTFWPEVVLDEISVAVPSRRAPRVGFRWERRTIPSSW